MPKAKAVATFVPCHEAKFCLKITARDKSTGKVSSVCCHLCTTFGQEENVGGKRKCTSNVKYFSTFRSENYRRHHESAHKTKWEEYQKLDSQEDREKFFEDADVPFVNTLHAHKDQDLDHIRVLVNAPIVETIVGDLLFHPDDVAGVTHERALSQFKKLEEVDPRTGANGHERDLYEVVIKTPRRFHLCIDFVSCGASFRMASRLMDCTRAESGIAAYGGCSDVVASNYTRFVCAYALQILSDVLGSRWAFAIALDGSTHQGLSYLDVRVRFEYIGILFNFHLMAIPLFERHTGENMFSVLTRFLDAVVGEWKRRCIAVSTDGARSMTGRLQGLVTRIADVCGSGLLRIWCGLHQLDLVMQRVYKAALDDRFYGKLTALIGHLRRQANLIADMRSTCPKVADTRWVSMHSVTTWLVDHRARVQRHLTEKQPDCAPDKVWWIFLHALQAFAGEAKVAFTSLQGLSTIVSQQKARLTRLVDTYCRMSGMQGPLEDDQIGDVIAVQPAEHCGAFVITHESVRSCLDGLGLWVIEQLDSLHPDDLCPLLGCIGKLFVEAADGISNVVCERDQENQPSNSELPPVLPCELSAIGMREFVKFLQNHRQRLLPFFGPEGINDISTEFSRFTRAYREEAQFQEAIKNDADAANGPKNFKDSWATTQGRFPMLQQFCGGLATAFPNTATVESDFSVIGWEEDDTRRDLTDFSLEGILHSKQFRELKKLVIDLPGQNRDV